MKRKSKTKNETPEEMPIVKVTIDDASMHLLGMIDEMRDNFGKEIERINDELKRFNDALGIVADNNAVMADALREKSKDSYE